MRSASSAGPRAPPNVDARGVERTPFAQLPCHPLYSARYCTGSSAPFSPGTAVFSSPCHAPLPRTCCSLRWVVAAVCAAALLACGGSEDVPPEADTALENDAIEGDAAGDDAAETDATEADAAEDVAETDVTEADAAEDVAGPCDRDRPTTRRTDATETDATETDARRDRRCGGRRTDRRRTDRHDRNRRD